jgi:signal transduction histidine kinase/ActR/RegA family two-component response regulator
MGSRTTATKAGARRRSALTVNEERRLRLELEIQHVELEAQNDELRTARVEGESNLRRYVELFDFAPIGYALLDSSHAIIRLNHMGATIGGVPRSYLENKPFSRLLLPKDRALLERLIERASASGKAATAEVAFGYRAWARHVRLTVAAGTEQGTALVAFEDLTDRKAWETRVAHTESALREADRRKDEFLAMLSHELRNPLAPMRSSLYALRHLEPGCEQAGQALGILDRQIDHLVRLVTDLMDVTRIARGKIQLRRERVELGALVCRTLEDYRRDLEGRGLLIEFDTGAVPAWVDVDPTRIVQAISNLLSNAGKFTPPGGRVIVTLEARDGRAALRVRDTGVGIPRELLGAVFTPFLQATQSIERSSGGLGLGLAMVKGVIELHGGSVTATSEGKDRGAEMTVLLPLVAAPAARPAPSDQPAPARGRRVLVVDDHADGADILRVVFELAGHTVRVAYDGERGLALATSFRPEVVVCDLGLPKVDGYEVAKALRASDRGKDMLLIAVSGYARVEDVQRATQAGFDRHFAKPANPADLAKVIAAAPATQIDATRVDWGDGSCPEDAQPESRPVEDRQPRGAETRRAAPPARSAARVRVVGGPRPRPA